MKEYGLYLEDVSKERKTICVISHEQENPQEVVPLHQFSLKKPYGFSKAGTAYAQGVLEKGWRILNRKNLGKGSTHKLERRLFLGVGSEDVKIFLEAQNAYLNGLR